MNEASQNNRFTGYSHGKSRPKNVAARSNSYHDRLKELEGSGLDCIRMEHLWKWVSPKKKRSLRS
jgi:hypothetical protein